MHAICTALWDTCCAGVPHTCQCSGMCSPSPRVTVKKIGFLLGDARKFFQTNVFCLSPKNRNQKAIKWLENHAFNSEKIGKCFQTCKNPHLCACSETESEFNVGVWCMFDRAGIQPLVRNKKHAVIFSNQIVEVLCFLHFATETHWWAPTCTFVLGCTALYLCSTTWNSNARVHLCYAWPDVVGFCSWGSDWGVCYALWPVTQMHGRHVC